MGRIDVSPVLLVELQSPAFPILVPIRIQAMVIRALYMEDFSENSLLSHCQCRHLEEIIHTVLQHHAMPAGLLRHIYQRPYIIQRSRCRHFYSYMLSTLHGIKSHRNVGLPVGTDIYEIHFRRLAEASPRVSLTSECSHILHASCLKQCSTPVHPVLFDVAYGGNPAVRNICKAVDSAVTAHSETYYSDPHRLYRFGLQSKDTLLSCRS